MDFRSTQLFVDDNFKLQLEKYKHLFSFSDNH